MSTILAIETTTTNCSVALGKDGNVIALKEHNSKSYSHAEELHPFIEEILEKAKLEYKNIDAVAVSMGPGSYTGLRIGVSAAKGLCYALNLPLIAIDTLTILERQIKNTDSEFIIPFLDARRMEVYCATYQNRIKISSTEAKILEPTSFLNYLDQEKTTFIGTGVDKFQSICNHPNASFIKAFPSAKEMIPLADNKFQHKKFEDLAYFKPLYLKDFFIKKKK